MNATARWISYGVLAISAGLGGLIGEVLGARAGTAGVALTVVWVAASALRTVRDIPNLSTQH